MENLSEIERVDARVEARVDKLVLDDQGFLRAYEDFSFCSTAQVQNGNVNQMQGTKVVSQNGVLPV